MSQKQDTSIPTPPPASKEAKEAKVTSPPEVKKESQPTPPVQAPQVDVPKPAVPEASPDSVLVPAEVPPPLPLPQPFIRRFRRPVPRPVLPPAEKAPEVPCAPKRPDTAKDKGELMSRLKAIKGHQMFRDGVTKFWALLQVLPNNRVPRSEMRKLMHRFYKLLLPRYNESCVDQVISYTLAYYIGNAENLDFETFTRIVFDVVHIWTPNVDLLEYVSFLRTVYKRIVSAFVHPSDSTKAAEECKVRVTVRFPEDERKIAAQLKTECAEWALCGADEIEQEGWEYTFKADPKDPNNYQKLKRPKPQAKKATQRIIGIIAEEDWDCGEPIGDTMTSTRIEYRLADLEQVLPLGYIAELFLVELMNKKEDKAETNALLTEELLVKNCAKEGLANRAKVVSIEVKAGARAKAKIVAAAEVGDIAEQVLQHTVKGGKEHCLLVRVPCSAVLTQEYAEAPQGIGLRVGCSLGLRRRLVLEQLKVDKELEWVNINYTLERREVKRAIDNKITLRADKDHLILDEEEAGAHSAGVKPKFDESTKEAPYLNDVEYTKFIQMVLGQKQNLIKRELRAAKHEEAKKSRPEAIPKMEDPLYKLKSFQDIRKDPHTSEHAVIDFAKKESLAILLIGKPRSGKSALGRELAKTLDLVYVESGALIQKLIEKVANYQPPTDLEEGQQPPKYLTDIEENIMKRLKKGRPVSDYQTVSLINSVLDTEETQLKGYILDLPFYKRNVPWAEMIRRKRIHTNRGKFSYIIELGLSDEDVLLRAEGIRCDPETGETLSAWERAERKKPKPKKKKNEDDEGEEGEAEEEEPAEDETTKPKVFDENKITQLANDSHPHIDQALQHYNTVERPALQSLIEDLAFSSYIHIPSAAGLTPVQLAEATLSKIPEKELLRPLARSLEPEGDFKSLLTQGLEENAIPRRYSPWKKVDPVALYKGKIEFGQTEQATTYAGYVFIHASEGNKKEFMDNPKKFLQKMPYMPKDYRVTLVGQRAAGKRTHAVELSKLYGWKIVDVEKITKEKVEAFRGMMDKGEKYKANNPETGNKLFFSAAEYANVLQGKGVELKDGLVYILEDYGIPVEKRKPPPPPEEEGKQPEEESTKKVEEAPAADSSEAKEEDEKKEEKKEEKKVEPVDEEPEYFEDEDMEWVIETVYPEGWKKEEEKKVDDANAISPALPPAASTVPGDPLVPSTGTAAVPAPVVPGTPAVPAPTTDAKVEGKEEVKKDAVSTPPPEKKEEPAAKQEEEPEEEIEYDDLTLADIVAKTDDKGVIPPFGGYIIIGLPTNEEHVPRLKELGIVPDKVIFLTDTNEENPGEEIKKRMATEDPFYNVEADAEYMKKAKTVCTEAYGEEKIIEVNCNGSKEHVLYNICSALDPFFPGIDDPSLVAKTTADLAEGARPLPKGEYADFCPVTLKKEQILIVGDPETEVQYKGRTYRFAGQPEMEEFKINPAVYVDEVPHRPPEPHLMVLGCRGAGVTTQLGLLSRNYQLPIVELRDELMRRLDQEKAKRKEMRRLLKGFKPIPTPEEGAEPEPQEEDPEVANDPEDFDRGKHEKDLFKELILQGNVGQLYDGGWFDINEAVTTPMVDLMYEDRRAPELVISLQIIKRRIVERLYNDKEIQDKYNKLMEERKRAQEEAKEKRRKEREEEKKKKMEEMGENYVEEPNQEEEEPEDTSEAPDLLKMQQEAKEVLNARYDADQQIIEDLVKQISDKRIVVIPISGDGSIETTQKKVRHALKSYFEEREHIYERSMAYKLEAPEVPFHEKSYVISRSKFGKLSPLSLLYCRTADFTCVYRDKLYYTATAEERDQFMARPLVYAQGETVPLEIAYKTNCVVLGPPKSGKSSLCRRLAASEGLIYLKVSQIIKEFAELDCELGNEMRGVLKRGGEIPDEMAVKLIQKRVQTKDCVEAGWVLENFPKTLKQTRLLAEAGILPEVVFSVHLPREERLRRAASQAAYKFGLDARVLSQRAVLFDQEIGRVEAYFALEHDNVRKVDGLRSLWFMEDFALNEIHKLIKIKETSALNFQKGLLRPTYLLQLPKSRLTHNLTRWHTLCPVCYRHERRHTRCKGFREHVLEKDGHFYFPCCEAHKELLVTSFRNFAQGPVNIWDGLAMRVPIQVAAQEAMQCALEGYCPVTLLETQRIEKGDSLALCKYKGVTFALANHIAANKLLEMPAKYETVKLPPKLPVTKQKVCLSELAKSPNSIPLLEETLGQLLTNGLLEIGNNRHKYPTLSVKETGLKLFALYLKANNQNNTPYMAKKYKEKVRQFIEDCELAPRIYHETMRKNQAYKQGTKWEEYEENNLNELGDRYDAIVAAADKEKATNFCSYFQ